MLEFFIGIISTILVGTGIVGAFFSVLGDDVNKLFFSILVVVIGISLPFIALWG